MNDTIQVDTDLLTSDLQITSTHAAPTRPAHIVGSLASLMLLVSAGVLPTEIEWKPVRHVAFRMTPGTTSGLVIREAVSSADILQAIANVHDALLHAATDLEDGPRNILYGQLWNLYQ